MGAIHIERESENRRLLLSFVKSIQERDLVTYEHSRRVATYAYRLARQLGWSRREASNLALAALVHDLGKTWIANNILNKSAALSAEERRTIERHPVIGATILIGCDVDPFYVETVLHHHEAWDGGGYPAGLQGEDIPLGARILAVADVYAAARERLLLGSTTKFDPTVVQAFLMLLDSHPNFTLGSLSMKLARRPPHLAGI